MEKLVCHCGQVEAEINIPINLDNVLRCNCSLCKRKGAVMSMVKNENFKIVKGKDKLKLYKFHTGVANHYFCKDCGVMMLNAFFMKANTEINPTSKEIEMYR